MIIIVAALIFLQCATYVSPETPENITITFLNPSSVKVSWMSSLERVEKYDVTYKPTDASYRVVAVVAGNSEAVTLTGLKADTQYQVTVSAVYKGKKFRSRPIVFRTLESTQTSVYDTGAALKSIFPSALPPESSLSRPFTPAPPLISEPEELANVRGIEIGIVILVLLVWLIAIVLFFNRWGKIRMLLPYQPDYKTEQLKVPGTVGTATATTNTAACNGTHASTTSHICPQRCTSTCNLQDPDHYTTPGSTRPPRPRLNSAIFTSLSGPGFEAGEFMRRHGSSSVLCRKSQSEENITSKHFGLPVLSISVPSPPVEEEEKLFECHVDNNETNEVDQQPCPAQLVEVVVVKRPTMQDDDKRKMLGKSKQHAST